MKESMPMLQADPVKSRALHGACLGLALVLVLGLIALYFWWGSRADPTGGSGIIGFLVIPLLAFAGAPWSFAAFIMPSNIGTAALLACAPVLNGALIGALVGRLQRSRAKNAL